MTHSSGGRQTVWTLVAAEVWRKARRRIGSGPQYRWRFAGYTPERVLVAPPDLRLADPRVAHDIYSGRYPLSGHLVETGGQSPFQVTVADRGWLKSLHGFRWLRHMGAARTELATTNARALVSDWIAVHGGHIDGIGWQPGTVAKRVIAWLQHSTMLLQGAELRFYRSFLRSLAVQVRYLRWAARGMPEGKERLRARIALAFAALSLPASASVLRSASRLLGDELNRQILPDGGHVSRNPLAVLELLADLIPLRQTYLGQSETPPEELLNAVDRMLPALRFFRHRDGSVARFNGMGATIQERANAILRHDDVEAEPLRHAPHSGYDRLDLGETVVIADTGAAPPPELAGSAGAGCLSFEMSTGRRMLIVNCGVDTYGPPEARPLGRATAAHSTVTLNDASQGRFNHAARISAWLGQPLLGGAHNVSSLRSDGDGRQGFAAAHDAYLLRFGLYHEREMQLSDEGRVLAGIDRFYKPAGALPLAGDRDAIAVRFHVHPDVELRGESREPVLVTPDGDMWRFTSPDLTPMVEDSIFFAGLSGPRRTLQIVLSGRVSDRPAVRWRFQKLPSD